jgi:hypothetical protein
MRPLPVATRDRELFRHVVAAIGMMVIGAVSCAGLSACVSENAPSMSGSSTPQRHGAWADTPNEPDWMGQSYTSH